MRGMLLYLLLFLVLMTSPLFAGSVVVDNQSLQGYNGYSGRWVRVSSYERLKYLAKKNNVPIDLIKKANGGSLRYNSYIFFPFNEEMISQIEESGKQRKLAQSSEQGFIFPIEGINRITSAFGMRNGELHVGVDFPSIKGTPIVAARDGRVVLAQYFGGYGKLICLEHRDNFFTRYSHNSEIFVKQGDLVCKGQIIGLVGSTGNSTGNHLHFEIRYKDIPLNPLDFLPENNNLQMPQSFTVRNWK